MRTTHLGLRYDLWLNGRHIAGPTHNPHELYGVARAYVHYLASWKEGDHVLTVFDTETIHKWHAAGVAAGEADIAGEDSSAHHAARAKHFAEREVEVRPSESHRWEIRQTDEDTGVVSIALEIVGHSVELPERMVETEYDRRCEAARLERLKAG